MEPYAYILTALTVAVIVVFLLVRPLRSRGAAVTVPQAAESAREAMGAVRNILVPTAGTEYSERGVELACRMGADQRAMIHLVYVIVVPRSLPMGTPMPDAETQARNALARAESIVKSHGMKCEVAVKRARAAGEGIIHHAKALHPDVLVVGMRPHYGPGESLLGRTTDTLLKEAPCEVIVDKMPEASSVERPI